MNVKKIWANLAVTDLDRTTDFYTALGFKSNGRAGELTSFLFGAEEFIIHFFLKEVIEANVNVPFVDPVKESEIMFTLSAETREEVDQWAKQVERAGGKLISQPEEFGLNYYGFVFADPDGHKFNVFYM